MRVSFKTPSFFMNCRLGGVWLALLTWLPFVGDVFAIALGFYRISPVKSGLFMLLGKFLRFLCWTLLFHLTGWSLLPSV